MTVTYDKFVPSASQGVPVLTFNNTVTGTLNPCPTFTFPNEDSGNAPHVKTAPSAVPVQSYP